MYCIQLRNTQENKISEALVNPVGLLNTRGYYLFMLFLKHYNLYV